MRNLFDSYAVSGPTWMASQGCWGYEIAGHISGSLYQDHIWTQQETQTEFVYDHRKSIKPVLIVIVGLFALQ